mgnify:CR=1 FL=1
MVIQFEQGIHQAGLAAAGRPKHTEELALGHVEVELAVPSLVDRAGPARAQGAQDLVAAYKRGRQPSSEIHRCSWLVMIPKVQLRALHCQSARALFRPSLGRS